MRKELIEFGKTAIDKASKFLELILSPPLEELGLLGKDQIKFWRFKNQVRILNLAQDYLKKKNVSPRKVPLKTLVPLLEYGSMEEEEKMQEKWAALLSKAADPEYSIDLSTIYTEVLRQLSPAEVKMLDLMFDVYESTAPEERSQAIINHGKIQEIIGITPEEYNLLMENLLRINLLKAQVEFIVMGSQLSVPEDDTKNIKRLSFFGLNFIEYCRTI